MKVKPMEKKCCVGIIVSLSICLLVTFLLLCRQEWLHVLAIVIFIVAMAVFISTLCFNRKPLIKCLPCVFACLTIALFLIILIIAFMAALSGQYFLQFNLEGFKNMVKFWQDYDLLVKCFAGCASIWIAGYTLNKSLDIYAFNSLSELRSKFNEPGKKALHLFLMKHSEGVRDKDKSDSALAEGKDLKTKDQDISSKVAEIQGFDSTDVLDYLGVVELGAIMLKREIITFQEFCNQFGYRIEYLLENDTIRQHVLTDAREYYDDLCEVIRLMRRENKLHLKDEILNEIDKLTAKKS